MTYSELTDLLERKKIALKAFPAMIDMTYQGFKGSIENQTLSYHKIIKCCELLNISPNEFMSWKDNQPTTYSLQQTGGTSNIQSVGTIEQCNKQLDIIQELTNQLKNKEEQINRLLSLLENK